MQLEAKISEKSTASGASVPDTMMAAIRANTDHWQDSYHRYVSGANTEYYVAIGQC